MSDMYINSGRMIDPLQISRYHFDIEELIHPICMLARYGGQTKAPYYVGEHTCKLYDVVPDSVKRCALLHDMSESIMVDMPRPIKHELPQYVELEEKIQEHIFWLFREPWANMAVLKPYDDNMCIDEMDQVFDVPFKRPGKHKRLGITVEFWDWKKCKNELTARCKQEGLI